MACCQGVFLAYFWGSFPSAWTPLGTHCHTELLCSYLELLQGFPVKVIHEIKTVQVFF